MIKKNFLQRSVPIQLSHFKDHFWIVDLCKTQEEEIEAAKQLLDQETINYVERLKFKEDQHKALLFHAIVRFHLGKITHCLPQKLKIIRLPKKKPYLLNSTIEFNLSHTKHFGFIAISSNKSIGIDIEEINKKCNFIEIIKQNFHDTEQQEIKSAECPINRFFSFWSAKEALLKANGTGFLIEKLPCLKFKGTIDSNTEVFVFGEQPIYVYNNLVKDHKLAVCSSN